MTAADLELYVPRSAQRALRGELVERRDPSAATQALTYVSPGMAQVPEWDAATAFRLGYLANVIAYRCVQIRAADLASVPILVGRKFRDRTTVIDDHPLARLLGPPPGGPAPKLSARKLLRWTAAQQIVTGRRAWEIETAPGRDPMGTPLAFWPLVSASLDVEESKGGVEWFRVFHYGKAGDKRPLQPDQVFYGWEPSGSNFRQAESALQALRFDLSLVTAADRYSVSFLRNNAVPATVVTTTAFPTDDHRRAFQRQWAGEYGGPDNAGRTVFNEVGDDGDGPVGESIDVKVLGLSQKDARLAEQRKEALMEVAIGLGVPWSKLDASGRTFDNAEVEDRSYWESTVLGDLGDLEDDLNMQIAPRFGDGVVLWFDLDSVRVLRNKVKPITQSVGAPAMVQAQLMKIDEARADYGLPALPDGTGDRFMTAEEITALRGTSSDAAIRKALAQIEARGAGGAETREGSDGTGDAGNTPPAPEPETREAEDPEIRRGRIWRASDSVATTLEARWQRAMARLFDKQRTSTLARLKGKRGRQLFSEQRDPAQPIDPAAIFDPEFWGAETSDVTTDLYEQVLTAGAARVSEQFGIAFDLDAPWVADFLEARSNQLAGQVTTTTYEALVAQLAEGVAAGESIDDLATRVGDVFADAIGNRATVIARTEVISAYNGSAIAAASTLPPDVIGGAEWIATRDGRVRPAHAAADGQVVAMGAPFTVNGEALAYPGDPSGEAKNTVQCRCTVAFLTPDEAAAALGVERSRVPARRAKALLRLVNEHTDLLAWRQALREEVAA